LNHQTPRIHALSPLVASQIAAGEVVERPASIVKELVENSIDAGATRITVELEQGGIELVRVSDDGHGILKDDLPLALAAHATSKVTAAADLERVATLGFRGEALASISSVSRLLLRSRTAADVEASEIEAEGEAIRGPRPAAGPVGTVVAARTLFFNTPARRKFLRTVATEQARCVEVVHQLAMAQPSVGFMVVCDGRRTLDLPPGQSPRERALAILGKELSPELLEVNADALDESGPSSRASGAALWGLVGTPALARATNKAQHVFINGRGVRDRTIQHAIAEAFRGLIEPSRYPTAVLMIELDPAAVDVNVHPTKAEVRFRDSSLMHSIVLNAIRRALRAADLTPTLQGNVGHFGLRGGSAILPGASYAPAGAAPAPALKPEDFAAFFTRTIPARTNGDLSYDALRNALTAPAEQGLGTNGAGAAVPIPAGRPGESARVGEPSGGQAAVQQTGTFIPGQASSTDIAQTGAAQADPASASAASDPAGPDANAGESPMLAAPTPASRVLQVHNSYLVTQDEQGVLIVDQHALHERVMFEYLLARVAAGSLESQRLLTPAIVPASPRQVDRVAELKPLFAKIGIDAEPAGTATVGVHSFASFLFERGVDPVDFMQDILERADSDDFLASARSAGETALRDVLDMMACKAAVKAGDKLSDGELRELLKLRDAVERSSNCPHGRPTTIRLTIRDLEKLFGRG
jgi:DNA mismatch repair protein MutL